MHVLYEDNYVMSKTFRLDRLLVDASDSINIAASRGVYTSFNVVLEDYKDKRFAIESTELSNEPNNCKDHPVEGLKVSFCAGRFKIVEAAEPVNKANAIKSSLDDLTEDELKTLLKFQQNLYHEILARLEKK